MPTIYYRDRLGRLWKKSDEKLLEVPATCEELTEQEYNEAIAENQQLIEELNIADLPPAMRRAQIEMARIAKKTSLG